MLELLKSLFEKTVLIKGNLIELEFSSEFINQQQTNEAFSDKWTKFEAKKWIESFEQFQKDWYLKLYGFETEESLKSFLQHKSIILDAGCGLRYKAAWLAKLSPASLVIGIDFSDSIDIACDLYKGIPNLFFIRGDIANTNLKEKSIDYISCDQVIHHTENPEKTFKHLSEKLSKNGEFACYVYAKKALPRELLDDYFRDFSKKCTKEQLWEMSEQLTVLGKQLSSLKIEIDFPDIPLLGIKGGSQNIQRFIYWNFLKCFWNDEQGWDTSVATNFDWYSPSNAQRYNESEFKHWITDCNLGIIHFHKEEACYSGRFAILV